LHKLVYQDISDSTCRQDILAHFASEASQVRDDLRQALGVKLLSDIDDTLYSSGGRFPAGCDTTFPKHCIYPGYLTLARILDRGWDPQVPSCNLVFLTARPHLYKDVTEQKSFSLFRGLVRAGRMHSFPTLLPGRLKPGIKAMATFPCFRNRAFKSVGMQKYETYLEFRELYREYDFVFLGDNGQGDLLAGQRMLQEHASAAQARAVVNTPAASDVAWSQPNLLAVLVRRVLPDERSLTMKLSQASGHACGRLIYHTSYLGAALDLHGLDPGLVPAAGLAEVAEASVEELEAARWSRVAWGARWQEAENALRNDLERCAELLHTAGLPRPPTLPSLEEALQNNWRRPAAARCGEAGCCCGCQKRGARVHAAMSPTIAPA